MDRLGMSFTYYEMGDMSYTADIIIAVIGSKHPLGV